MAKFEKGESGNRKGRKIGSRPRALALLDEIGQGAAADVVRSVVERAKNGDAQMASLLLARCWPPRRGRPIRFEMPQLITPSDVVAAIAAITEQVSSGQLSPEEGEAICGMIEGFRQALETQALEARIAALEAQREP